MQGSGERHEGPFVVKTTFLLFHNVFVCIYIKPQKVNHQITIHVNYPYFFKDKYQYFQYFLPSTTSILYPRNVIFIL